MSTSTEEELAAIEARASAVADAFDSDVPLELDTYVWKYAPGQQKRFTSIRGEQGEIAAVEGWAPDEQAAITALIDAVTVAREDVPALFVALQERDTTIARVREVLQRLHDRIVFSSKDFGEDRFDVGLYGVIVGWDADEDDRTIEGHVDAWPEIQRRNPRFTDAVIAAIRADHAVIRAVLDPQRTP
ncbi:hypothetical protein CH302_27700 [Rhodococcus sp. 15-2388-1-1a]|uniref:hypothetical protein n=1 Tax=Rhodococcus sp. 15-2388-1-1a TaxID=2023142 RepID=UPI000B9B8730|nr:hypothetical protein [Rhodococcus sp. 15-2388-1-1a]OZE90235.1 hypothetical protein CH302_27700 [Rhodococcus sp. 15-2388-1-1a]